MDSARSETGTSVLRRALAIAGSVEVVLRGASMSPLIASGARARVVACTLGELRRFDVAVYERGDAVVAHLVVGVDRDGPRTAPFGAAPEPVAIRASELLGYLDGLVVRRRALPVPRTISRSLVAIGHASTRALRSL